MTKTGFYGKWKKITAGLAAVALLACALTVATRAENVVIEEHVNPDLTFHKIISGNRYSSNGTFKQEGTKYTIKTNANVCWEGKDDIDIAYRKMQFNYGKKANLTVETKVESWSGAAATVSAGIMLRSSLAPDAASVFFGPRPQGIFLLYRFKDGVLFAKGPIIENPPSYPMYLKVVLSNSKVTAYYRTAEDQPWAAMSATVPFQLSGKDVYAAVCCHTSDEVDTATAVFDGFKATVDAPEGTAPGGPTDPGEEEPELQLPEDLPVTDDVLLRETFTDDSITDGLESVTNPIWTTTVAGPQIITNADFTNRYLHQDYTDDGYYRAGNQLWTDYTTSADITFPKDHLLEEANEFVLLVRHQSIPQYGYNDYGVIFKSFISGASRTQKLQIGTRVFNTKTFDPKSNIYTILAEKEFPYQNKDADQSFKLRVDTVDNVITVYINGVLALTATDNATQKNVTGGVGLYTNRCNVNIDNIEVRRLYDPMGGDYDNKISGNFNQAIPEYLERYVKNKWTY